MPFTPATDETCSPQLLSPQRAQELAQLFRALADPTRLRIWLYLARSPEGTVCSCQLPQALGVTQPTMSHHLSKLVDAGLIAREKRGRWAHFTATTASQPLLTLIDNPTVAT